MPRFYETTLSITNLHNLSISTHVNRSRIYLSDEVNVCLLLQLLRRFRFGVYHLFSCARDRT